MEKSYSFGPFQLDLGLRRLTEDGQRVPLTPKAFDLLAFLVHNRHRMVSKDELLSEVWPETHISDSTLSSTVSSLRKALGEDARQPVYLETVFKKGYRFIAAVDEAPPRTDEGRTGRPQRWASSLHILKRPAAVAALALGSVLVWFFLQTVSSSDNGDRPPQRSAEPSPEVPLGKPLIRLKTFGVFPTISPDGTWVAFSQGGADGRRGIYVLSSEGGEPRRLSRDEGFDVAPGWSPDSSAVAFVRIKAFATDNQASEIVKVDLQEGSLERCLLRWSFPAKVQFRSLDWTEEGILFVGTQPGDSVQAIHLLNPEDSSWRRLEIPGLENSWSAQDAALSPDGRQIAFYAINSRGLEDLFLLPLDGGRFKQLTIHQHYFGGLSWIPDGSGIVFSSNCEDPYGQFHLWKVPRQGGDPQRLEMGIGLTPHFSNAGAWVYDRAQFAREIAEAEIARSRDALVGIRTVLSNSMQDFEPQYSPDGRSIAYTSSQTGLGKVWVSEPGTAPRLLAGFECSGQPSWSPDGSRVAFVVAANGPADIYVAELKGGAPEPLTSHPDEDFYPSWSQDGVSIYFSSSRSGSWQVWKKPLGSAPPVQLTRNGGLRPLEDHRGEYVYFQKKDEDGIWRIPVRGGEEGLVVKDYRSWFLGLWALGRQGVYFVTASANGNYALNYYDLETAGTRAIGNLGNKLALNSLGLSISPDETRLLFTRYRPSGSEIVLVRQLP